MRAIIDSPTPSTKPGKSAKLLVAAVCLVIVTMVITYYRNVESRESARWVAHTYRVIEVAQNFLSSVGASDAILLNLTLTHDSSDQAAYHSAIIRVDTLANTLFRLTIDNPSQAALVDEKLIPLVTRQQRAWAKTFHLYYQGSENYLTPIHDQSRTYLLDSIRYFTSQFIQNEEALAVVRNQKLKTDYRINDILRFSFLLIIGITCIVAFFTIRRQQNTNALLVANLEQAKTDLETRVQQRTEELSAKNRELQESMEEIQTLHHSLDVRNQKLEESLGEVQLLYDLAPCGYHTVDASGLIVKINKTELDWLGYTEEEVAGKKNVSDILTPASVEMRRSYIDQLKTVGKLDNLEFDVVRKDGSTFPVLLNMIAYFDANGKYVKNRSSVFDISHRKQLEKRLEDTNTYLTHLNQEKNRFIGIATHDLKNPIHGILGLVQLLKQPNNLNEEQHEYIRYIESSIAKMKTLISKLLDLNRIEQVGSLVQKQPIDLATVLVRIHNAYREEAKRKSIELIVEQQTESVNFETDPSLLDQIIDNLVSNAIKFSRIQKNVWLRIKQPNPRQLVFEIEDQGPGISPEELPLLFIAFQRLSARPTGGESSTGLGLSIVKAMVQALGAEIAVKSEEGVGTIFRVTFELSAR